jgi:hypothetical protein
MPESVNGRLAMSRSRPDTDSSLGLSREWAREALQHPTNIVSPECLKDCMVSTQEAEITILSFEDERYLRV